MQKEYIDKCTVFSTIVGSQAYGTSTPDSDTDIRGIAVIDDPKYYFGFVDRFEQYEDKMKDIVIYDIRKAFKLISDANPNMVDLLFTDERFFQVVHPDFQIVIDNKEKFLSKRVRYTYTGYAFAQLKRIKTARGWLLSPPKKKPERSDFGLPDAAMLSKDDLGAFQWVLAKLLKDSIDYTNLTDTTKEELENANWIGLIQQKGIPLEAFDQIQKITGASDMWMETMRREQMYLNAKRHFDSYMQWKDGRNKKRAELEEKFGYDTKHAAHLVRLMRMGKEILTDGKVMVFRPDREELKAIRNGAWPYDKIEQYANDMEQEIITLSASSTLPNEPNRPALDKMCSSIIYKFISNSS